MIVSIYLPVLLLSIIPMASTAPAPSPLRQEDDLGAQISEVLLVETISAPRDESSSQSPLLRLERSPWQQSMQWHPTTQPRRCYKRYNRRQRRWMKRACHFSQAERARRRRRRRTTTTTTTTTTPGPPTSPPTPRTKKRCFKRFHKKYKKYVTRCVYW